MIRPQMRFAALLCLAPLLLAAAWHRDDAAWRRVLRVEPYEGAARSVTTLVCRPTDPAEATGLALIDAAGKARPFAVLASQGSRLRLLFDAASEETLYLYGVPGELPAAERPHRSGLLHRSRVWDGGELADPAAFDAAWKTASPQGADFVPQVFTSANPHGPNANALHRYDGFIDLPRDGKWTFSTASTDASWLLIDGRAVAAWPGAHDVREGLKAEHRGSIDLKAGRHRFAYLHANASAAASYAIAAIIPPGEEAHAVIPPELFAEAAYAYVGRLERPDGKATVDFVWQVVEQLNLDGRELYQLRFEAALPEGADPAAATWELGDGASARGATVEHCYFAAEDYPVRLTAKTADGAALATAQTVGVRQQWGRDQPREKEALALIEAALAQEAAAGIDPRGYATLVRYLYFYLREARAAAFARRCLAAADRIPPEDAFACFQPLALGVQLVDEQYDLAEACFRQVIARAPDPRQRNSARLHGAGMLNLCRNQPRPARDLLAAIEANAFLETYETRLRQIYAADVALVLDGVAAASRQYHAIAGTRPLIVEGELDRPALARENARYFELRNILEQQLYRQALEELDILEWENPPERLNPATNLLKAQALRGNDQPRKAIVCLERALMAEVDDNYRPRLRLELARLHFRLGHLPLARKQITLIQQEDPWSREEIEARKLLREIDKKIEERPL